ncbi:hypothetical protein [Neobacillus cucumis]|uniref:hypothetical protein n=1 Tax=Neobacillus cucumis TaxID=1740721 RepID=UPI001965CA7E|nr:hypothetical protein [Neobacillus cucumis]MBM7656221.1 hypothetical protein [Neobacillus cucumis]
MEFFKQTKEEVANTPKENRKEIIQRLANEACDRNDAALKKMDDKLSFEEKQEILNKLAGFTNKFSPEGVDETIRIANREGDWFLKSEKEREGLIKEYLENRTEENLEKIRHFDDKRKEEFLAKQDSDSDNVGTSRNMLEDKNNE